MPRRAAPSARSRMLAIVLRELRRKANLSASQVARELGMSSTKITRIETCEIGVYLDDLETLLDFYRVEPKRRAELLDLARHAEQREWLRLNNPNLPADWQTWSDFEDEASALCQYQPLVVPGLLQTPEYAAALILATGAGLADAEVDALVASRMARQGLLSRREPLRLHAIIEQSVFERSLSDGEVLARQLRSLADAAGRPNITIQVLPSSAGLHGGLNGPFIVLDYPGQSSLIWLENKISSLIVDDDEQVGQYQRTWGELDKLALGEPESVEYLNARAGALAPA
ncbi:MAG: helix-turn-helix domain-containing protein [Sciscionella sp.]